jgi:hypothetical protein
MTRITSGKRKGVLIVPRQLHRQAQLVFRCAPSGATTRPAPLSTHRWWGQGQGAAIGKIWICDLKVHIQSVALRRH